MGVRAIGTKVHFFRNTRGGFTLVELMITVGISAIIVLAVYNAYIAQQDTYLAQEQVAEMQQNIRVALDTVSRDVRMAGYSPSSPGLAGITTASPGQLSFTQDLTGDGDLLDAGEVIDLGFTPTAGDPERDVGRDGLPDNLVNGRPDAVALRKQINVGGYQSIAENIQAIEFLYLDELGAATATLANIRAIQISILARANRPDPSFTNTITYTPASGVPWDLNGAAAGDAANDNFRRRLLITTVQCRNLGL